MKPFLKWVGGKRQLLKEILPRIPEGKLRYVEPFVGGGAVFFALYAAERIETATLNDVNVRLMMTYRAVRYEVDAVKQLLSRFSDTKDIFLAARSDLNNMYDREPVVVAADMIFLNRTCFNGLYRENSRGEINSPWAPPEKRSKGPLFNPDVLDAAAKALWVAQLTNDHFSKTLNACAEGDFAYIDPPYVPLNEKAFTAYTKDKFGTDEQIKLAEACRSLNVRGVKFLASNSDTPLVHKMYEGFTIETIPARRSVNRNGQGRGVVNEVLIRNY